MTPSQACYDLIKRWEGFSAIPYLCPAGYWTIGYGHVIRGPRPARKMLAGRLAAGQANKTFAKALSYDYAHELLVQDLSFFAAGVAAHVRSDTTQAQFDAMVSFAYNVGLEAFRKSTLLRCHNAGERTTRLEKDFAARSQRAALDKNAPDQFLRWTWAKVKGHNKWLTGLFNRRLEERALYLTTSMIAGNTEER